jgi:hypothetical protein
MSAPISSSEDRLWVVSGRVLSYWNISISCGHVALLRFARFVHPVCCVGHRDSFSRATLLEVVRLDGTYGPGCVVCGYSWDSTAWWGVLTTGLKVVITGCVTRYYSLLCVVLFAHLKDTCKVFFVFFGGYWFPFYYWMISLLNFWSWLSVPLIIR